MRIFQNGAFVQLQIIHLLIYNFPLRVMCRWHAVSQR